MLRFLNKAVTNSSMVVMFFPLLLQENEKESDKMKLPPCPYGKKCYRYIYQATET